MRGRRLLPLGTAALLVAALAGCAGRAGPAGPVPTPPEHVAARTMGAPGRAVDLLPVVWHVHDAAGAERSSYLVFGADDVTLLTPRGFVEFGWSTQGAAMLARVQSWSGSLGTNRPPAEPWLTAAASFRRIESGWALLDADGRRVATLRNDGPPPSSSTTETTPEPVTAFARARVADAVPGPGTRTIRTGSILGRWTVAGLDPKHALLTLYASSRWRVEGGCASDTGQDLGGAGSFRLLRHGVVLLVAQPVAGVGCATPAVQPPADTAALARFAEARSISVEHDRMTLFDRHGKRIGRLTRTS